MSYIEIYNEKVYDILSNKQTEIPIREDASKNIVLQGIYI